MIGLDGDKYFQVGAQLPPGEKEELINLLKGRCLGSKGRGEQAGAIKEAFYPNCLANTVVVKKKNGKWHVCVDFTDLTKTCPKNPFSIPRIDQVVDAIVRHPRMSFLDVFQGYH